MMTLAEDMKVTPAQLALAWLLHRGEDVFPIPGSRRKGRVDENAAAAQIGLSEEGVTLISEFAPMGLAEGNTLV